MTVKPIDKLALLIYLRMTTVELEQIAQKKAGTNEEILLLHSMNVLASVMQEVIAFPELPQELQEGEHEPALSMLPAGSMSEKALRYLYKELKAAKIAWGNAERKPNTPPEELANLKDKVDAIDWLIPLAIKEIGGETDGE